MKRLLIALALIVGFTHPLPVTAQIGPIDPNADTPNPCSCAPQYYSACCGPGQAQLKVRYCQNQNPSECTCTYNCRVENAGSCGATSASACQGNPPSGGGNNEGGSGGWGGCGSCSCGHGNECVQAPDGSCHWDPGTCNPENGGGGGATSGHGGETQTQCNQCGNRLCGQSGCTSRHTASPGTPSWQMGNQATLIMPANDSHVALEWRDPYPRDSCQVDKENHFDLQVYQIDSFGGAVVNTALETRVSRGSVYVEEGIPETNQLMRYYFTPSVRFYRASIRAVNTICSASNPTTSSWTTVEFQVLSTQTGKIYLDTNDDAVVDANGRCVSPTVPGGSTTTSIITQRNEPQWAEYNFDGWGWTYKSNWPAVSLAPLGSPFAPSARFGSAASIVDGSGSTYWASSSRGDDTNHRKVGINFTTPQEGIQVVSIQEYNDGGDIKAAPHTSVNIDGITAKGAAAPYKSWMITPGITLDYIRFTTNNTGFTDDERWGVAEIRAYRNPNPAPSIETWAAGVEKIATAGWTDQGAYSVNSAFGVTSTLELNLNSDEYTCSCPEGCVYRVSRSNQSMNFFINVKADPWFQVQDGGVAAYGDNSLAISNPIPAQCTPANGCAPVLVRTPNSTAPVVMTGGGMVDVSDAVGQQTTGLDDENKNWLARLSSVPSRQDFAYFKRIYKLPSTPVDDFELNFNHATKPNQAPRNHGVRAYYQAGDLEITTPWHVEVGEAFVILVDGTIHIQNEITVAEGGFLALVSRHDIVFAPSLGTSDVHSTTPVVEGVYIADGKIRLSEGPLKFVGAGTFVGWGGFELGRDFQSTDNWHNPTELFIYRPDFLQNAPDEMKVPRYDWNEVNP